MSYPRRFPPPWKVEENTESFVVTDGLGQRLAFLYFEDEPQRQMSMKRLSKQRCLADRSGDHSNSGSVAPGLSCTELSRLFNRPIASGACISRPLLSSCLCGTRQFESKN